MDDSNGQARGWSSWGRPAPPETKGSTRPGGRKAHQTRLRRLQDTGHTAGSLQASKHRGRSREKNEFQCCWISLASVEAGAHRKPGETARCSSPRAGARTLCLKD